LTEFDAHATERDGPDLHELIRLAGGIVGIAEAYGVQLTGNGRERRGLCPFHDDRSPSLNVNPAKQTFICRACGAKGGAIDFIARADRPGPGRGPSRACARWPAPPTLPGRAARAERAARAASPEPAFTPLPVPPDAPPPPIHGARHWAYRNADGSLAGYVIRVEKGLKADGRREKAFLPLRWGLLGGGVPGWHSKGWEGDTSRPLYRLPELLAAPTAAVLVAEGEKAAVAAARLFPDLAAVACLNGARSPDRTDWTPLGGRRVIVWPDHDDGGRKFAADVARLALAAGATSAAIVRVPDGASKGWDLADDLPDGWAPATLRAALDAAVPVEASPEPTPPRPAALPHAHGG
jgi:hypothetical protein